MSFCKALGKPKIATQLHNVKNLGKILEQKRFFRVSAQLKVKSKEIKWNRISKHEQQLMAENLKAYLPRSASMYNIFHLQSASDCYSATPINCDTEPSLFVKITTTWPTAYVAYCRLEEFKNILEESPALDWSKMMYFVDLSLEQLSVLSSFIKRCHGKLWTNELISMKWKDIVFPATPSTNLPVPDGMQVLRLGPEYADHILHYWPYRIQLSRVDLRKLLTLFPGVAFARKDTGQLISWSAINDVGRLGYTHTVEEYRRKGITQLLMGHLCAAALERKLFPCGHVLPINEASIQLNLRSGMEKEGSVYEAYYLPPQPSPDEMRKIKILQNSYPR